MTIAAVSDRIIEEAATIIRQGGVVAYPTETYYGLAVDPFNRQALELLFQVKQRSPEKAILNLINDRQKILLFSDRIEEIYLPLMDRFWPGPLTLLFTTKEKISPLLTCGSGSIALRISSHPVARCLCDRVGNPITATSANLSGRTAATTANEVEAQLGTAVDLIIDGGLTPGGKGSTIVGTDGKSLKLIRAGVIDFTTVNLAVKRQEKNRM